MAPIFSLKYNDKRYPGFICAADWDYADQDRRWSRSLGLSDGLLCFEYTPAIPGLDKLAFQELLNRFGLRDWEDEIPMETKAANWVEVYSFRLFPERVVINNVGNMIILKLGPAQLIALRRAKEKLYNLPRLEINSDNLELDFEKGARVFYSAEEYK